MDPELEELFQDWEKEEKEYQIYLKSELEESMRIQKAYNSYKNSETFYISFIYIYFNLMVYCMKFIVDYVEKMERNKRRFQHKIEKPIYSVEELD